MNSMRWGTPGDEGGRMKDLLNQELIMPGSAVQVRPSLPEKSIVISPSYSRRNQSRLQKRAATTAYSVPAKCGGCPAVLAAEALSRLHLQGFSRDRGE